MIAPRLTMSRRATLGRAALLLPVFVALLVLVLPRQAVAATPRDVPPPPSTIAAPGQTPAGSVVHASVSQARQAALAAPAAAPDAPTPPPTVPPPPMSTPPATPTGTPTLPPNSSGTNLSASPGDGLPKAQIALDGTGFEHDHDIQLRWDNGTSMSSASGQSAPRTDGNGHFYVKVLIPDSAAVGGNEVSATDGKSTAYTLVKVDTPTTNTDDGFCFDLLGAHVCIPTPSSILFGIAQLIEHYWGNLFTAVTYPFDLALTYAPDLASQSQFSSLQMVQQELSKAAGPLLVFFLTIGVLAGYLTAIGRGQFQALITPIGRAIFVTGVIAGYENIMSTGFKIVGGLTSAVNGIHVGQADTGFDALGKAFGTITDLLTIVGIAKMFVVIVGVVLSAIAVVIRYTALGYLDLLYIIGPVCLVTYISPQFSFIARWWWRTTMGLALYPLAYALVLKVIANVLTITTDVSGAVTGQVFNQTGGLVASLAALGLVLMIYRVPGMVGSLAGAGAGFFGSAASAVTDAGIAASISLATRGIGNKIPLLK